MDLKAAYKLARGQLDAYGLVEWRIVFDRAFKRAGLCIYSTKTISLSRHFVQLNDEFFVFDMIHHEIAHALAGRRARHGPLFMYYCRLVGAYELDCCYTTDTTKMPKGNWRAQCPTCGRCFDRHRKPRCKLVCDLCVQPLTWCKIGTAADTTANTAADMPAH